MKEECMVCKAPLEYLETDEMMECALCRKKESNIHAKTYIRILNVRYMI